MCIDWFKQRIQEWRKEWINCNIEELMKQKEKAKFRVYSFFAMALCFMAFFADALWIGSVNYAIVFLVMMVYFVLLANDSMNDCNRINMWIFLKENNKK